MLKLKNVIKNYGGFSLDCSMEVTPGCVTGLIGANGAGKSTTFKAILGLIRTDGGEIEVFGKAPEKLTRQEKEDIGVVLAESGFSEYLKVKDVAGILRPMYGERFDRKRFWENCERFGVPQDKKIKTFSTGMKAKLKLLVAISHRARLLVLDEPTAGLDVVAREELLELIQECLEQNPESSVLISSHISADLEKFCDDIYMIDDGKIVLHEETDVLLDNYGVLKVDEKQFAKLDQTYLIKKRKEIFGYSLLTKERQFYMENYPQIAVEKGNIDDVILMMTRGESL